MGTTTNRALRYPGGGDTANVPLYLRELAEDVDAQLGVDTGWLNLVSLASGWSVPSGRVAQARRIGNGIYCRGFLQNASFNGGFTTVGMLPAAVGLPAEDETFGVGGNTIAVRSWQLLATGAVQAVTSAATASFYGLASIRAFTD